MKWMKRFAGAMLLLVLLSGCAPAADVESMAAQVYQAAVEKRPFPVLTVDNPGMTEADSYAVQKLYSEKLLAGKRPAGFKAGLTTEATMKRFGSDVPFAAVLFPDGYMDGSSAAPVVKRSGFGTLMIESEIGFVLGEGVSAPLKDIDELKGKIAFLAPAIELPDLSFTDMKALRGIDINAAAISSRAFILGKPVPKEEAPDINGLVPVLALDGTEVNRGTGSDALEDQWKAALWLVNKMVEEGWTMEKGDVLLTGALGNMIPGKPGKYEYDAGALGRISFTVE